jgi:hypothetical protein
LQINSNLTTTTTTRLQILYDLTPPKFTEKFQNKFLSAIWSNTLQAGRKIKPMLEKWVD